MTEQKKITIDFTLKEARVLLSAISGFLPPKDDELISTVLYMRIASKIEANA